MLACFLSLIAAFFVVFNSLFSDVASTRERIDTLVYTCLTYGFAGFAFGALTLRARRWAIWFGAPAAAVSLLLAVKEPLPLPAPVAIAAIAAGSTYAFARLGSALRRALSAWSRSRSRDTGAAE